VSEQGPPGFGDPDSIRATGEAAQQAVSELDKLTAEVTANVRDRVPDAWSGSAGTAAGVRWEDVNTSLAGLGSPVDAYRRRMADAATTMSQAREALDIARSFASRNDLHVNADLSVTALNPSDPNAPSLATAGQQMLIKARAVADNAQQQIRTANQALGTGSAASSTTSSPTPSPRSTAACPGCGSTPTWPTSRASRAAPTGPAWSSSTTPRRPPPSCHHADHRTGAFGARGTGHLRGMTNIPAPAEPREPSPLPPDAPPEPGSPLPPEPPVPEPGSPLPPGEPTGTA
jgi:uncharacterized protein YukE